jgi:hypothetical protein
MNIHIRFSLILLGLIAPVIALAAPPGDATGLKAEWQTDHIAVSWTAPADQNIAYYRIYFSRKSILQNNGQWDDFATTPDAKTTFNLSDFPKTGTLYLAVLAVNQDGEETQYFTEEAAVTIPSATQGSQSSSAMSAPAASSSSSATAVSASSTSSSSPVARPLTFGLLSAESLSSTGALLTFSHPVILATKDGPKAFVIKDQSGTLLVLTRLKIEGGQVTITTYPQYGDKVYTVTVGTVMHGQGSQGQTMNIDPSLTTATFVGGGLPSPVITSSSSSSSASSIALSTKPPSVSQFRIRAEETQSGFYLVQATWVSPADLSMISGFRIEQSRDKGKTFAAAQSVPATAQGVRFRDVSAGDFGIAVSTVAVDGTVGDRVFSTALLPAHLILRQTTTQPVKAVQPTKAPTQTRLPQSGPGIAFVIATAGAVMGWRRSAKRKN